MPQTPIDPPFLPPGRPPAWHRTVPGVIFLSILGFFGLGILFFIGLTAYYGWQIHAGRGQQVQQALRQEKISWNQNHAAQTLVRAVDRPESFIHAYNPIFGNPNGPVTIIAFLDFECPFCQEAYSDFHTLMNSYEPAVRVVFKYLPLTTIHPNSMNAALAAACAHEQGKFWAFYDLLFTTHKLDVDSLNLMAKNLSLNLDTFHACFESQKYERDIETDIADAARIGARGTPTYIVGNTILEGVTPLSVWNDKILSLLNHSVTGTVDK